MSKFILISELHPHPQNSYYFDDITGSSWDKFLESIRTSNVLEPIVITQDKMIISGHQRVRACKELGIDKVKYTVQVYPREDSDLPVEDQILKDLIETNLRTRAVDSRNLIKLGRCIKELERIYGIREGSAGGTGANQHTKELESNNFTEADLAEQLGMTRQTLQNYKQLADLIPEVEDFLDTGMISATTALAITRQLSVDDQVTLLSKLDANQKYTAKKLQPYIDEIKKLKAEKPKTQYPADYQQIKDSNTALSLELKTAQEKILELEKSATLPAEIKPSENEIEDLKYELLKATKENIRLGHENEHLKKVANAVRSDSDSNKRVDEANYLTDIYIRTRQFFKDELFPLEHSDVIKHINELDVVAENFAKLADLAGELESMFNRILKTKNDNVVIEY